MEPASASITTQDGAAIVLGVPLLAGMGLIGRPACSNPVRPRFTQLFLWMNAASRRRAVMVCIQT